MATKRKTLREELAEYKDKYLRALAELDNYKKRAQKEREEFVNYANESLILKLIPILDDFERGIGNCKLQITNYKLKNKEIFENLYRGIELIHKNFKDTLEKEGLKSFNSVGKPFDPRHQEAVSVIKSSQHPPNTVVEELSSGYMLRDKIIRPAKVIVSKEG